MRGCATLMGASEVTSETKGWGGERLCTVAPKYKFSSPHHFFSSPHHFFSSPHHFFSSPHHFFSSPHLEFSSPHPRWHSVHRHILREDVLSGTERMPVTIDQGPSLRRHGNVHGRVLSGLVSGCGEENSGY